MPVVTVGKALREKLGDEGVESLIDLINQSQNDQKAEILEIVEEKFERRLSEEMGKLRQEIAEVKVEMSEGFAEVRAELKKDIAEVRTEMKKDIADVKVEVHQTKSELIKWMFIFWIGQIGMILGILFAFFKH